MTLSCQSHQGMEFVPGAQNTHKTDYPSRNSQPDFQPPMSLSGPPPLPPHSVAPSVSMSGEPMTLNEFKPQPKLNSLTPEVPEFVPRPLSQGHLPKVSQGHLPKVSQAHLPKVSQAHLPKVSQGGPMGPMPPVSQGHVASAIPPRTTVGITLGNDFVSGNRYWLKFSLLFMYSQTLGIQPYSGLDMGVMFKGEVQ